ncbi:antitoxin Xre/MbcA/ParS toxin-binding domain-containing protein [Pseudomonas sp. BJa3]|uniref:antitoxin Xre/MbcA/ParS toxin-binding domain-containing protein n=1 Tax=Pseudomonas sp. BJa3 TaxID=2986525 RepID=UPI002265E04A|nr:antitoxin Xre/MbcA/ParS toxin-binding domain-containing protein [Pseudomonas sp. BJa3]MCX5510431.1 DUF2384 domain-containing protein [Pseudomonas sp. BJa3]
MRTLPPDQQVRYLEVLDAAKRLFGGDLDSALNWMSRPIDALGGKTPASMITTKLETHTIIDFIWRLEHGFVA